MTEQTGQRGEVETGASSARESRAETSMDEADDLAGPNEQSGHEGDSGSPSGGSGSSSDSRSSSDSSSSDSGSSSSDAGSNSGSSGSTKSSSDKSSSDKSSSDKSSSDSGSSGSGSSEGSEARGHDGAGRPRGRRRREPVNVGEAVWKGANALAAVVRIVGYLFAAILVAYLVLTIVGVNVQNGVARLIGGLGNAVVVAFRDLFLIADPTVAIVVNYGLAAVFWVLVAEFGSRLVRYVGARLS